MVVRGHHCRCVGRGRRGADCVAYSQLAGVPPVNGLYASILPLLAYAAFGSSRQLIMAPDAATCAIVAATVLPPAGQDTRRYVSLTAALAVATGIVCIAAGLARLGFLTNFLARPILTGYRKTDYVTFKDASGCVFLTQFLWRF
jgi:MFS superfamily sulfate permease-like transporter